MGPLAQRPDDGGKYPGHLFISDLYLPAQAGLAVDIAVTDFGRHHLDEGLELRHGLLIDKNPTFFLLRLHLLEVIEES